MSTSESDFEHIGLQDESEDEEESKDGEKEKAVVVDGVPRYLLRRADSCSSWSTTDSQQIERQMRTGCAITDDSSWSFVQSKSSKRGHDGCSSSVGSSVISNFDLISLGGSTKKRCRICTTINSNDNVICVVCGIALVANPCLDIDAQIALNLKQKEDRDALKLLQEEEERRHALAVASPEIRAVALSDDILSILRSYDGKGLTFLDEADLQMWCRSFISTFMSAKMAKIGVGFYETFLEVNDVRIDGLGIIAKRENMRDQTQPTGRFLSIPEDRQYEGEEGPECSAACWIVAFVEENETEHALYNQAHYLPLARFRYESTVRVANLKTRLSGILSDFLETDWTAVASLYHASKKPRLEETQQEPRPTNVTPANDSLSAAQGGDDPLPLTSAPDPHISAAGDRSMKLGEPDWKPPAGEIPPISNNPSQGAAFALGNLAHLHSGTTTTTTTNDLLSSAPKVRSSSFSMATTANQPEAARKRSQSDGDLCAPSIAGITQGNEKMESGGDLTSCTPLPLDASQIAAAAAAAATTTEVKEVDPVVWMPNRDPPIDEEDWEKCLSSLSK